VVVVELALDFWIDPDELPTEVAELSDADEAAELAANSGVAEAQASRAAQAKYLLKRVMAVPGGFSGPAHVIAHRRAADAACVSGHFTPGA
jgi:hypothetical protein